MRDYSKIDLPSHVNVLTAMLSVVLAAGDDDGAKYFYNKLAQVLTYQELVIEGGVSDEY
ncbi:MAG: hypothetical protein JKY50_00480 [Oleispira sp.]|nr:hypothetical protein [Oleispira sp.]